MLTVQSSQYRMGAALLLAGLLLLAVTSGEEVTPLRVRHCLLYSAQQVTFQLGALGEVRGITVQTKEYSGAPLSNTTYYKFRNLYYAE